MIDDGHLGSDFGTAPLEQRRRSDAVRHYDHPQCINLLLHFVHALVLTSHQLHSIGELVLEVLIIVGEVAQMEQFVAEYAPLAPH